MDPEKLESLKAGYDKVAAHYVERIFNELDHKPLDRLLLKSKDGRTLNDAAFALINAGEYDRALPFARKAMRDAKIGTLTRGYATFNVGYALLNLGRCGEALPFLRRSLRIQPVENRVYIQERITAAQHCAQGGASGPPQLRSSGAGSGPSRAP